MRRTATSPLQAAMHTNKLLVLALLAGCTDDGDAPCGRALRITGDDAPIGSFDAGVLTLDEHLLAGLPSDGVTVRAHPLLRTLELVVPTEDGDWRIGLVSDDGAVATCDWRFRTEVWTDDVLLGGRVHTWHLLKHSTACAETKEIARWSVVQ